MAESILREQELHSNMHFLVQCVILKAKWLSEAFITFLQIGRTNIKLQ